ncbi:MAG: hypothetical protein Q7J98_14025 [Kiritimatiellia bacterium]|nr:hypothetical protein [Kiritimatiellia bacterium]
MKRFFSGKVIVEELPMGGADSEERRIISAKGEMAQILNRAEESFQHLVYWDLDSAKSGQLRGNHYHLRKTERYYVISGQLDLFLEDITSLQNEKIRLLPGSRVTLPPRVAHSFKSLAYSQVLEFSPGPYDPSDTKLYACPSSPARNAIRCGEIAGGLAGARAQAARVADKEGRKMSGTGE